MAFAAMYDTLGRPPVMLVDLRPVSSPMLVIGSYEVAEQITKATSQFPCSPPKDLDVWAPFVHLAGTTSILTSKVSKFNIPTAYNLPSSSLPVYQPRVM